MDVREIELKPCPFCGSDNVAVVGVGQTCYAGCNGCGADGPFMGASSRADAIAKWNRRSSTEQQNTDAIQEEHGG